MSKFDKVANLAKATGKWSLSYGVSSYMLSAVGNGWNMIPFESLKAVQEFLIRNYQNGPARV